MDNNTYDLIILGGGPAGLTAAIYAARGGLKTLLLDKMGIGGQAAITYEIENYPGFDNIDGYTLTQNMLATAKRFGLAQLSTEVHKLELENPVKKIVTAQGIFQSTYIILCTGAFPKNLGLSNESAYLGKGLSYCATCDGGFFRGKHVAVVGGGNTAVEEAIYLSPICSSVTLVHRRDCFRAPNLMVEKLKKLPNVTIRLNSTVQELKGEPVLKQALLKDEVTGESGSLEIDGLFVAIGRTPETQLMDGVELDSFGYVLADEFMRTNIPGVYAAGDVRQKFLRQIVTACADGAIAAEHILSNH